MPASLRPPHVTPVPLSDLLAAVAGIRLGAGVDPAGVALTGVALDNRAVLPGDLYAALPGANVHGARFAAAALQAGAVAVLTDPAGAALLAEQPGASATVLVADDPRAVLGAVSARVYGTDRPGGAPRIVGITGTNGKTTTAYLLEAALRGAGLSTGLIGTIETRVAGRSVPSARTTPESPDLHGLLALMAAEGVDVCVMEVSSHALALHRVDGVVYDAAAFTNLSQDHLDFHGSMEAYYAAKASLFTRQRSRAGVVVVDDAWGRRLADEAEVPVTTLSSRADVEADRHVALDVPAGAPVVLTGASGPEGDLVVRQALPGGHNRINAAVAALLLRLLGVEDVTAATDADVTVPGRMEHVDLGPGAPDVYVDFAHTPEAITATLSALSAQAARSSPGSPVVALLGAGGDRDAGKRPLMGAAAARGADVVVVTDDNPRRDDPARIRAAVLRGAREAAGAPGAAAPDACYDVPGREAGIERALTEAGADGVVALLGKGHERTQTIGEQVTPFDDREVARRAWARRSARLARPGEAR